MQEVIAPATENDVVSIFWLEQSILHGRIRVEVERREIHGLEDLADTRVSAIRKLFGRVDDRPLNITGRPDNLVKLIDLEDTVEQLSVVGWIGRIGL